VDDDVVTTVSDNDVDCGWELKGPVVEEDWSIYR
jgi:hypothetical protein